MQIKVRSLQRLWEPEESQTLNVYFGAGMGGNVSSHQRRNVAREGE